MGRKIAELVDYPFKHTSVFLWNRKYRHDYFILNNQGGTSSSKTYSVLQCIILDLLELEPHESEKVATIVGETMPNLKKGAIRDFENIRSSCDFFNEAIVGYNKTDNYATLKNGAIIEFVSYENFQAAKAGKRKFLQVTESNGIKYEIVKELIMRTTVRVYFDYNANRSFWVHEHIKPRKDCVTIYSNFLDNEFCPEQTKKEILSYKTKKNPNDWLVYGCGRTGKPSNTKAFFTEFDEMKHVVDSLEINPDLPLLLSFDFNYNPVSAILSQLSYSDGLFIIKEFQQDGGTQRLLETKMQHLVNSPYSIEIVGDNSGHSRHSSAELSDFQIIENFFHLPVSGTTRKANLKHMLSRTICNKVFHQIPVYISKEGCPRLIEEILFAEETIDGRLRKDDKEFRMDLVDAFRYGINFYFRDSEMVNEVMYRIKEIEEKNNQLQEQHTKAQKEREKRSPIKLKVK